MTTMQKTMCSIILLVSVASAGTLRADDADRAVATQINTANSLLRDGDVDGAIAAYQELQELVPPSANLEYNYAVAQYRKGDVSASADHFKTLAAADNDAIAAKARFNLGNCDYVNALQQAEQDRPAAIENLESAIENYRSALDVNSADAEARANIELASQLIDKLRKEEEQEQQQQQDQQQKQQQQDQSQQQQNEEDQQQQSDGQQDQQQQNEQQQSGQQSENQQQDDQQQEQNQSQSAESAKQDENSQEEDSERSEDSQQENDQSKEQKSKGEDAKDKQSANENSQADQQERQDNSSNQTQPMENRSQQNSAENGEKESSSPETDATHEEQGKQPPKGELSAAQPSDQKDKVSQQKSAAVQAGEEGEITEEEAAKMLQAIRDRDMIRRLRQQAAERNQHIPVDRDW
ncbi:50S ribosomal protein L22 [Bythopirellula polymerisocia]|uniref:50S ribosomal protein L22 n=2 Tax=Bythopirellula polymerisocia TaxID=2528003 RepID=A0A5C6CMU2_9BACT|nr:50S ribosomal protein L22 [Bythopirellula polymerisocia]